jgi:isopenicillin-N N-acyltransferase-like protein
MGNQRAELTALISRRYKFSMKKRSLIFCVLALCVSASVALVAEKPLQPARRGNLRILELQGTPYERGKAHGQALKPEIRELVKRWKANLEKSFSVPAETYIRKLLEASDFQPAIERWTPDLLDEVRGIADGAGVDFQTMYAFQLIDETWVMSEDLGLSKCTTIGARRRGDTPAFVAQNLDIPSFYHGFQTALRIHGSEGEPGVLVFTIPGIIAANGLNDRSIGVCVNAVTQLAYSAKGLPVAFVIRGVLRQRKYAEAVRFLKKIQPAAPQNYVLGGPDVVASFERSAERLAEFIPFKDAEFTYHTNHPVVNDDFNPRFVDRLKAKGMSLDAYRALCPRFKFLEGAFNSNSAVLDLDVLKRVFANREARINNAGTYGCTIMMLGDRPELHIAAGRPDEVPFEVLGFEQE